MRAREAARKPRGPRRPLAPQIAKATQDLRRAVDRIERLATDDRFAKAVARDRVELAYLVDRLTEAVTT
jgi:hypothetical protein